MHVYNFSPLEQSMIQGIVESDQYGAAGINQMVNSLYALFGVGIATMVYWTFGIYRVWLIIFVTCLFQAILLSGKSEFKVWLKRFDFSEYSF